MEPLCRWSYPGIVLLAGDAGLEPTLPGPKPGGLPITPVPTGAAYPIWTGDPSLTRRTLYQAELRRQGVPGATRTRTAHAGTSTSSWRVCHFRHGDMARRPGMGRPGAVRALAVMDPMLRPATPLEPLTGFEPGACRLRGDRSCQLSYRGGTGCRPESLCHGLTLRSATRGQWPVSTSTFRCRATLANPDLLLATVPLRAAGVPGLEPGLSGPRTRRATNYPILHR